MERPREMRSAVLVETAVRRAENASLDPARIGQESHRVRRQEGRCRQAYTWREGNISPVRGDIEVPNHFDQMTGGKSCLLEDFCEQGVLRSRYSQSVNWLPCRNEKTNDSAQRIHMTDVSMIMSGNRDGNHSYLLLLGPWPFRWIRHIQQTMETKTASFPSP